VSQGRAPLSQTESAKDSGHYRDWASRTALPDATTLIHRRDPLSDAQAKGNPNRSKIRAFVAITPRKTALFEVPIPDTG
jgi:hypothetical protein